LLDIQNGVAMRGMTPRANVESDYAAYDPSFKIFL